MKGKMSLRWKNINVQSRDYPFHTVADLPLLFTDGTSDKLPCIRSLETGDAGRCTWHTKIHSVSLIRSEEAIYRSPSSFTPLRQQLVAVRCRNFWTLGTHRNWWKRRGKLVDPGRLHSIITFGLPRCALMCWRKGHTEMRGWLWFCVSHAQMATVSTYCCVVYHCFSFTS